VSREGLALLHRLERDWPALKERLVAVDFNPETLEQLQQEGIECHYGDISNIETLRHAGLERATMIISSVSDSYLCGTDNLRLLRLVRALAPSAKIVVTADSLERAEALYAEGADYVLIPPALAAEHLYRVLKDDSIQGLERGRRRQASEVFRQPVR
jgi:Trk K+ transport system NAD-binding subunit